MKIQLDTTNKLIKVEEQVSLGELIETLKSLFPDGEWTQYNIVPYVNYSPYPIWVEPYTYPINPWYQQPFITYKG